MLADGNRAEPVFPSIGGRFGSVEAVACDGFRRFNLRGVLAI